MNSVNLIGNIGHELELNHTNSGKAVLNFSIAVNKGQDEVNWFRITAWEKTAKLIDQYCGKGSTIGISGSLTTNTYTNKDNIEVTSTEVIARMVKFLDTRNSNQQNNNSSSNQNQQTNNQPQNNQQSNQFDNSGFDADDPFASNDDVTDISDDDLPF